MNHTPTTTAPAVDFRRFDDTTMRPEGYRDWVLEWRKVYKQFSALRRYTKLERRRCQSAGADEVGRPDLEERCRKAAMLVPAELLPSVELMRPRWQAPWFATDATAMLDARATGKRWFRANCQTLVDNMRRLA